MSTKRNEVLKKRYQVYRRLGYDSYTSRALSQRSLDVSQLEISDKTGKLKRNTKTKTFIDSTMREWRHTKVIDRHTDKMAEKVNDTVYTRHGMYVKDPRYKGETGKIISIIRNENKTLNGNRLTTDQAYYFYYFMNENGLTYQQAKTQLLSSREFEIYVSKGKR